MRLHETHDYLNIIVKYTGSHRSCRYGFSGVVARSRGFAWQEFGKVGLVDMAVA